MQVTYILKQLRVFNAYMRQQMSRTDFEIFWLKHAQRHIEKDYGDINDEDDVVPNRKKTDGQTEFPDSDSSQ